MHAPRFLPIACVAFLALGRASAADELGLSPNDLLDVSALGIGTVGDLAFEKGASKLWVSDGSPGGLIHEVSPINGALVSTVDPAAIPGLDEGPDALAILSVEPSPDLFAFSPFGESEGGRISQAGALVADFGGGLSATGADVDAGGNLWIAAGTAIHGGSTLRRIHPATGAVLQSVAIQGTTSRAVDLAFDPHTGACYVLLEFANALVEVDLATGAQLSSTDLSPFLIQGGTVAGGVEFHSDGHRLYLATGTGTAADTIVVLEREFATLACDGSGAFGACPCGNAGAPGRGCENSFATGGGRLQELGIPQVSNDSYALSVTGVPPTTSVLFFQGTATPASGPFAVGDGLMCVSGTIVRLATRTTTSGSAIFPVAGDPPLHVVGQIPAGGATRLYQAWYRNPVAFCNADTFNFTNAIRLSWVP